MHSLLPILLLLVAACSPDTSDDPVVRVDDEDAAMNAAITEARATVGEFIAALEGPAAGDRDFSVKVPIHDGDETEHCWLVGVSHADGTFTGTIGNTPQMVSNVKEGQRYETRTSAISDWMFFRQGVAIGNRTARALFPHRPDEEVAAIREILGWD